jgi:hypothetical protein
MDIQCKARSGAIVNFNVDDLLSVDGEQWIPLRDMSVQLAHFQGRLDQFERMLRMLLKQNKKNQGQGEVALS